MTYHDLRPLGIGEILDRAIGVFVRSFAVLIFILALVAIPIAICQYIAQPQTTAILDDLRRVLAAPPGHGQVSAATLSAILAKNRLGPAGFAILTASMVLSVLSTTACVIAIAQAYAGKLPSVRVVYREALRRWFAQIVALVVYVGLAFALLLGLFVMLFFVALAFGALAAVSTPAALIFGIPAAVIAALVLFAVGALLYLAVQMSFISIALEDANPIRGIAQGLRRTLSRPILWRSLLVATIVLAVTTIGTIVLLFVAGALDVLTHVTALYPIVAVVGGIVLNALVTTFIVIYAFDVRVRREGYDLALVAGQSAPLGGPR